MARVVPKIFKEEEGAQEEKGEYARLSAYLGAIAIADLVKTTLGPKGMDKILQPISGKGNVTFTNDGATILKSIHIDNPAAKILVDVSKTQDSEIGDGTTSVAVLSGELLREAEKLVAMKIHPQTIIRGWRSAVQVARNSLEDAALDHSKDSSAFKLDLLNIAKTTLSSKILSSDKDHFAQLAVDAVLRLGGSSDLSSIQILKKVGGQLQNSYLEDGFILDKRIGVGQPKRIENAKILVMNTAMDTDKIKIYAARVRVNNVSDLAEIENAEKEKMKQKVEKILKHGVNVVINRQLIYNYPEQLFTDAGVVSIEHADFEGVERLALVLDAEIASTFEHPDKAKLGRCDVIEEIVIGEDRLIRFRGVAKGAACTIVLRGSSAEVLEEAERSLHDALCVLVKTTQQPKIVYGGGCSESLMAKAVDELATRVAGKEALAVEAFARALRAIPATLADNGGYDSSDLVTRLRAAHYDAKSSSHAHGHTTSSGYASASGHWYSTAGLDMDRGQVGDMSVLKITEPLAMKMQVLVSAHEAAEMILRVDNIVRNAPRKRQPDHRH